MTVVAKAKDKHAHAYRQRQKCFLPTFCHLAASNTEQITYITLKTPASGSSNMSFIELYKQFLLFNFEGFLLLCLQAFKEMLYAAQDQAPSIEG